MATDVPVKDLHEFIYYPLTGQNSYVFVIDNNGLVLIHPAINGKKLARLNPQPNMAIEELEFAVHNHSHVKQLHREMILMNPGTPKQLKFDVYIKSKDELRVRRIASTYHFFRSTKSPFSTGIASPKFGFFVQSPNITFKEGLKFLKNVSDIMHWPFCPKLRRLKDTKTVMVQRIAENENKTHLDTCNHRMVHGLLLDAKATSQLPKQWKSKREKIEENGINHIFIRTHWGVIQSIKRKNNSELIDGGFESISRESYDPFDFYKRANHIPNRLTISLIKGRGEDDHVISIHNPILQKKAGITLAVTGVEMSYEKFMTTNFIEKTKEFPDEHLYDGRLTCDRHLKNQVEGLYCYLLDENGFVVASNEEADIGLFFGEVDQNVMRKLIEEDKSHSLYQVVTLPDYQASCKLPTNNDSSAAELKNIFTWIISLLVSLLQTSLFSIWTSMWTSIGSSARTMIENEDFIYVSCVKNTTMYLSRDQEQPIIAQGMATCDSKDKCLRNFTISSVVHTNLYLLVVDPSKCGACKTSHETNDHNVDSNDDDYDRLERPGEDKQNILFMFINNLVIGPILEGFSARLTRNSKRLTLTIKHCLEGDGLRIYDRLKPIGSQPPRLYGLAKIHKDDVPLRPVLSMPGSSYYKIAKKVTDWLSVVSECNINTSTKEVSESLDEIELDEDAEIVSFHVVSLYTNVPVDDAIQVCSDLLYDGDYPKPPVDKQTFIELLTICSKDVIMLTDDGFYRQTDGLAMGSPPAPMLANGWMSTFETKISEGSKIYNRYMDDILRDIAKSKIDETLTNLNGLNNNLKFTIERKREFYTFS
ncbi:voltage-dependent calcium channel subunit alpha-2/delta-3-like [Clytia hemisphaerica]|uniref:voltage-dependent calcium channel subunit alpha-2/delta-3-like n=1 Tax=Clytia hemisphaerica TaxID=252671 RepID=UPI0034D403CA